MTEITLYNTRTRRKEPLVPVVPGKASMYVCGPTVYDRAHIGNARPVVVFDTLFRLLRHTYGNENVTYVRNITDVEDKINARARESGRSIGEITAETTRWYHEDMAALGNLPPPFEPRATAYVGEMLAMIARLIERGHAYAAEGHVLFSVGSYPDYGKLARRSLDDMRAGARVEVAPYKRDPMDFVLWKPSNAETPGWDSPWGRGRPGWHIECSAMARALLGGSFDIHGGGVDLAFPHHENELAQSMCAHPDEGFARVWMHNGMLNIEGEKMSKSLGNFLTVRDLLDKGIPGEVIRFVLLSTHYRQPIDWKQAKVDEARKELAQWRTQTDGELGGDPSPAFLSALRDDLNTAEMIAELRRLFRAGDIGALKASAGLLGLLDPALKWDYPRSYVLHAEPAKYQLSGAEVHMHHSFEDARPIVQSLLDDRVAARARRDFDRADEIRKELVAAGIVVNDTPAGVAWSLGPEFDIERLKAVSR